MSSIGDILTGIVQTIGGIANSFGGPLADFLNGLANSQILDASMGTTIIIFIMGALSWKFIENKAILILALLILGGSWLAAISAPALV